MNKKERELQEKMIAKLRQLEIAKKRTGSMKLQESGYVPSQLGGVCNKNRVIELGHYEKTSEQANLDYKREQVRRSKKEDVISIIIIKAS